MTKPTIRIHNIETNKIVDREMTDAEFDAYEAQQAIESTKQAETEAKVIARAAILERLGLTEQEAALLLS